MGGTSRPIRTLAVESRSDPNTRSASVRATGGRRRDQEATDVSSEPGSTAAAVDRLQPAGRPCTSATEPVASMASRDPARKRFSTDRLPKDAGIDGAQATSPSGMNGSSRRRVVRSNQNGEAEAHAWGEQDEG